MKHQMGSRIEKAISWINGTLFISWVAFVAATRDCQESRDMCLQDETCALTLDVIEKTCGDTFDGTVCRSSSLETCQGALTSVWTNPPFEGQCWCGADDVVCLQLRDTLSNHPCLKIPKKDPDYDKLATVNYPTCTYAFNLCVHNFKCKKIYDYFRRMCKIKDNQCGIKDRVKCHKAWNKMQFTPIYGCLCYGDADIERCAKIYNLVNTNPCVQPKPAFELTTHSLNKDDEFSDLGTQISVDDRNESNDYGAFISIFHGELMGLPPAVRDKTYSHEPMVPSTTIKAKSTCQRAHSKCVQEIGCKILLENMLQVCDTTRAPCNRTECMMTVRHFYNVGNPATTHAVAFCICKFNDPACLIQQRQLHPPCAQRPEVEVPPCHHVAEQCKADPDCRRRMDRFVSACEVDQSTIQCRGPLEECRLALIDVLGTPLRTNCACSGTDVSLLYSCIDWQRLVWLNPCVVQAQKDYHEAQLTTPPPIVVRVTTKKSPETDFQVKYPDTTSLSTATQHHSTPNEWIPTVQDSETCEVSSGGNNAVYLPVTQSQRIYDADSPECSKLCWCRAEDGLHCDHLRCLDKISCRSSTTIYPHMFRAYRAFRGLCTCYSGNFICAKPADGIDLNPGVYLFLGYSKQEELSVKNFTNMTITNTVKYLQQMLDNERAACRLAVESQIGDNLIVLVYMNEFNADRINNSMTPEMVLKEEEICMEPLGNLTRMINQRDPKVHKHVVLSILKLAVVEVHPHKFKASSTMLTPTCVLILLSMFIMATITMDTSH